VSKQTKKIGSRRFAGTFEVTGFGGKKKIRQIRTAFKEGPKGTYAAVVMPCDVGLDEFIEDLAEETANKNQSDRKEVE